MASRDVDVERLRKKLENRRRELTELVGRVKENIARGLDRDSKERAKELEDSEVVDALGNEAMDELRQIRATLVRIEDGSYGTCEACGEAIGPARLEAYPYASHCIDCAEDAERARRQAWS